MVFGTILALQLFIILLPDNFPLSLDRFIILLAGFLLTLGLMNFIFPQIALMDLHFRTLLRNSLFLLLGNLPRSLGAVSWQVFLWGLLLTFLPDSFFLFILFGFWVPVLPALFLIYSVLDREFKIEESLKNCECFIEWLNISQEMYDLNLPSLAKS